jgi:excisionase family DNA binding protein
MNRPLPPEPLFTPKAAALRLGISVKTLLALVVSGKLRFIDFGTKKRRMYRFTEYNLNNPH